MRCLWIMFLTAVCFLFLPKLHIPGRGIEWSLRAFASMRAVCLLLRARAVVKFFLRAASALEKYRWQAASTLVCVL